MDSTADFSDFGGQELRVGIVSSDLSETSMVFQNVNLETKSCRILPLTYRTKYDMT